MTTDDLPVVRSAYSLYKESNIYTYFRNAERHVVLSTYSQSLHTAVNLLKPKTLCNTSFNIQNFCVLPTMHLCVLCVSENKRRLFPYTALTYRVLKPKQRVFTAQYEMGL
jgi:hypothetical protein